MVIRKKGTVFCVDGKEFKIGGGVFANDESEYMGLYGTVTEIRTDEDRETENDTPDIYCEFMPPDSVAMAAELETRFSDLYRQDMEIDVQLENVWFDAAEGMEFCYSSMELGDMSVRMHYAITRTEFYSCKEEMK